jgi:type IV secretory pathway VirB10-like protein
MTFIKKIYPPTVTLRKNIIIFATLFLLLVVALIFINIYRSSQQQGHDNGGGKNGSAVNNAAATTALWYQNLQVRKMAGDAAGGVSGDDDDGGDGALAEEKDKQAANAGSLSSPPLETLTKLASGAPDDELTKAMRAAISANQITADGSDGGNGRVTALSSLLSSKLASPAIASFSNVLGSGGGIGIGQTSGGSGGVGGGSGSARAAVDTGNIDDPNLQSTKQAFMQNHTAAQEQGYGNNQSTAAVYLQEQLQNPLSPYELKAGAIIPAILITGINSDLPGQITAQVRSNVYDTIAGKHLLIPQGAKLTGVYDAQVAFGQQRVLVVWKRIIFPNGQSINLEGMPGVDMSGFAGFKDQVDNHYFRIFGSVILMSLLSAGAQMSQPQQQFDSSRGQLSVNQALAASLGTNIMNTANSLTQKNLGVQPTLVIRSGYLFNVTVTKDIVFPSSYVVGTSYGN